MSSYALVNRLLVTIDPITFSNTLSCSNQEALIETHTTTNNNTDGTIRIIIIMMNLLTGDNIFATLLGLGDTKLDVDRFTTVMAAAGIVQGSLLMFTPNLSRKMWGVKDKSVYTLAHLEYVGAAILSMGLTAFCLFVVKMEETLKIIGWTLIVWTVENALALLKRYPSKAGGDPTGQVIWLFLMLESVRACFVSTAAYTYTHRLLVAAYSLGALNDIVTAVKPRISANIYGYKKVKLNIDQLNTLRGFGYENLALSVFHLSLLNGVESHKALALNSIVITAHCTHALVGKTFNSSYGTFGSLLFYFWLIFHASCAANLLLSKEVGYFMGGLIVVVSTLKLPIFFVDVPQIAEDEILTKHSWWWKEINMGN
jgi:hypothetical protein